MNSIIVVPGCVGIDKSLIDERDLAIASLLLTLYEIPWKYKYSLMQEKASKPQAHIENDKVAASQISWFI